MVLFTFALAACGGGGGAPDFSSNLGGGYFPGEVRPLTFDPSGQASLQFGELSGGEEFALIFFAANSQPNNFGIQVKSGTLSESDPRLLQAPAPLLREDSGSEDPTTLLHSILREEEALIGQAMNAGDGGKALAADGNEKFASIAQPWKESCANGQGMLVKILASMSNTDQYELVCARHYQTTGNADYFVDEASLDLIPAALLNPVIEEFEKKIDRERELLGRETDVNGDGRFAVCFCSGVNRLGAQVGGYVTGFFFGADLFPQSSLPASNEKEILFISVPDPTGRYGIPVASEFWASNIASSVLPHEYQHMINYRYKVFDHSIGAEEGWANEGLSHLLEDLNASDSNPLPFTGKENPSRVGLFLESPEQASFISGTTLAQRGGAYLFFRYLYEQSDLGRYPNVNSGRDLLQELIQSPYKGVHNIEEATGWSFRNLLLDFYATVQLSQTGITEDPRYNFHGINLFGDQNDNRGTILAGVNSKALVGFPIQDAVRSPGGLFFNLAAPAIKGAGSKLQLVADPNMVPGGALIRIQ